MRVVIDINNTVTWVNQDTVPFGIRADNRDDPAFFEATRDVFLMPGETFQFTFTKEGTFSYHGEPHPWKQGTVTVLHKGTMPSSSGTYFIVSFEGLKETYAAGEPIDFFVKLDGYGCDSGFPHVIIKRLTTSDGEGEIVWSRSGEIRLFPAGYDCPDERVYKVVHIGDMQRYQNDDQERRRIEGSVPIILEQEGTYAVEVKGGGQLRVPQMEFQVISS